MLTEIQSFLTYSSKSYLRVMRAGVVAFALSVLIAVVMPFLEPGADDVRVKSCAMRRPVDVPADVLEVRFWSGAGLRAGLCFYLSQRSQRVTPLLRKD